MTTISLADADTMFRDCIVEYEGELVVVRDVIEKDDEVKLAIRKLGANKNILINADPDLVYCPTSPYRLGYVQYGDTPAYLSRAPRRQYKIGWCQNNVNGLSLPTIQAVGQSIVDNLKGVFPSFKEAIARATEMASGGVAFDRQFAVCERGKILYYKGQGVAYIKGEDADLESHNMGHIREWFEKAKG